MTEKEFIIALTVHRNVGHLFLPYLIQRKETFFSIERQVKLRDINDVRFSFKPYEKELIEISERYSDERLMKRFSRDKNVTGFFANLEKSYFEKHIVPFIEQCMFDIARILMLSPVRLMGKEDKYTNLYDEDEIHVQPFFAKPRFIFERNAQETRYRLRVFMGDKALSLLHKQVRIVTNEPCLFIYRNQLIAFEKLDSKKLTPFFTKEYVTVPRKMEEKYYAGFIRKTIRDYPVIADGFRILDGEARKTASLTLEYNLKYEPCLVLRFHYDGETFLPNARQKVVVHFQKEEGDYVFRKIRRDLTWEKDMIHSIGETGLKESDGSFTLSNVDFLEKQDALYFFINWLNENRPALEERGVHIEQGKLDKKYFTGEQRLEVKTAVKDDWFDVYAIVHFGGFKIPFIKLKNFILNDIREFELPDGQTAIIPLEWFSRYKSLIPFAKSRGEKLRFGRHHFPLLHRVLQPGDDSFVEKIRHLSTPPGNIKLPGDLKATLRSYQKEGFRWMFGLHKNGFGGCLADDMGLGKTLQTLALLLKLKRPGNTDPGINRKTADSQLELFPSSSDAGEDQPATLIVLPTSLVHNWEAEIRKFTPSLKLYKHVGPQRRKNSDFKKAVTDFDVILTTYGIVRNDAEMMSETPFFFLILDESQYVKNPSSKTYKAVLKLSSGHKLVLTGTPIENNLSDLWAQMNFLNKGILGNLAFFRRYFMTPIEKHNSDEPKEKLQILIRPFILRRTKEEVARDLPPLMEQVVICEMEEEQQRLYEAEKSIIRNTILAGIENKGINKSAMIILQGLTRLRQLANHPLLLDDVNAGESGKFDEIFRMLENVVAEKHKVLVFSSFVKHLELLKKRIIHNNWNYSMLTGKTDHREKVISRFQDDPGNHIFLISLKAGGVGLNLTGADYVFIIDPWWNPAAENQAISRAHRIGQTRHVFVYRFITEYSIEEKIQQLKMRKRSLADKFINSNNPLQEITKEEVLTLFK